MKKEWTTCSPHPLGIVTWFGLTFGFCVAAAIVLPLIGAPIWVMSIFTTFAFLAVASGIAIARARVRYNDSEIESRYFRHIKRKWDDVEAWSRIGENGPLFIRFKDGIIIGSDGWALDDKDVENLVPILQAKNGSPKIGEKRVMPWYVRILTDSIAC